jgi:NAD-dependent DNA ligase
MLWQWIGRTSMASKNLIGMMVEKGAPFTIEQLQEMDDKECWNWVYMHHPPKTHRGTSLKPEICFTGFRPDDRTDMEKLADENGYRVVRSVTVNLKILVKGEAPGPSKLEKARQQRVSIISRDEFLAQVLAKRG